jgi:DNA-binding transcriptional MerR regulator
MAISAARLGRLAGLTRRSIHNWCEAGLLTPNQLRQGNRYKRDVLSFTEADVVRALLGQELRKRGFPLPSIAAVLQQLASWSLEDLDEQFATGRDTLFCVGDSCFPRLLRWQDILCNPEIDLKAAADAGVPFAIVNVEKIVSRVRLLLEQEAAQ